MNDKRMDGLALIFFIKLIRLSPTCESPLVDSVALNEPSLRIYTVKAAGPLYDHL